MNPISQTWVHEGSRRRVCLCIHERGCEFMGHLVGEGCGFVHECWCAYVGACMHRRWRQQLVWEEYSNLQEWKQTTSSTLFSVFNRLWLVLMFQAVLTKTKQLVRKDCRFEKLHQLAKPWRRNFMVKKKSEVTNHNPTLGKLHWRY